MKQYIKSLIKQLKIFARNKTILTIFTKFTRLFKVIKRLKKTTIIKNLGLKSEEKNC